MPTPLISKRNTSASETILSRNHSITTQETALQTQVDSLVGSFVEQATDWKTLAALTAGGFAYRYGRIGTMSLGNGHVAAMPLRILSIGFGLGTEVTAFEFTNRTLLAFHRSPITDHPSPSLWSWNGPGGWKQSLVNDLLTFGMLKGAGYLSRESNVVFQHAFSSTAMVAGHQGAALLGITPKPEGSLAEQLLHAEITNLQLGAGASLVHAMAPGVSSLERGLDLTLRMKNDWADRGRSFALPSPRRLAVLLGIGGEGTLQAGPSPEGTSGRFQKPLMMSAIEGGGETSEANTKIEVPISPFILYSKALFVHEQIRKSLTEARQWSLKLNLNRPGKLVQGQHVTAQFEVFSQDGAANTSEKGQLGAIDIKKIRPLVEAVQWARRVNRSFHLGQEISPAGVVMDQGQATLGEFGDVLSLSAQSGRIVLPTPEAMNTIIDNLERAEAALQRFIEEGKISHEETTAQYREKRSQYESVARQFNVEIDVLLARTLKTAASQEILEALAPFEWTLPKIIDFILEYRLKGGIDLVVKWTAEKPALLTSGKSEDRNFQDATPLLLEAFQNEVWEAAMIRKRKDVVDVLSEMGNEAAHFVEALFSSFQPLTPLPRRILEKAKENGPAPLTEIDLEFLDVLWDFAWGDRLYSFLPHLAQVYSKLGKTEEACRFLKDWYLSPEEIEQWAEASIKTGKGGLLRGLVASPASLLKLGDNESADKRTLDESLKEGMVTDKIKKMWSIVKALGEMQDLEGSRDLGQQLLGFGKGAPSSEEIATSLLIKFGGDLEKKLVHRRLQNYLDKVRHRSHQGLDDPTGFLSLAKEVDETRLFSNLVEIAEGDVSDREIVKEAFKELLQDKSFLLSPPIYSKAANWLIAHGDPQEKGMAEHYLSTHKNDFPLTSEKAPSHEEGHELASLTSDLDHPDPYTRLKAAEDLVETSFGKSGVSPFPYIKVVQTLEKILATPDADPFAALAGMFGAKKPVNFASLTTPSQELRARASRLLDRVKPGWDESMVRAFH